MVLVQAAASPALRVHVGAAQASATAGTAAVSTQLASARAGLEHPLTHAASAATAESEHTPYFASTKSSDLGCHTCVGGDAVTPHVPVQSDSLVAFSGPAL